MKTSPKENSVSKTASLIRKKELENSALKKLLEYLEKEREKSQSNGSKV